MSEHKGNSVCFSVITAILVKMYAVIIINGNVYSLDEPLRQKAKLFPLQKLQCFSFIPPSMSINF
jgi:hypothetical protein